MKKGGGFYVYRSYMGAFWSCLQRDRPHLYEIVAEAWLIFSIDDVRVFDGFQLLRVKYRGVEITIQYYPDTTFCVKLKY